MDYTKAIQLIPKNAEYYYKPGNANYYLKDYKNAENDMRKCLELDPNNNNCKYALKIIKR